MAPKKKVLLVIVALMLPAGAFSAGPVRQSSVFFTIPGPRISVTNLYGAVLVRGWGKPEIHAVYVIASPHIEIDAEQVPPKGDAEKVSLATHLLDRTLQGQNVKVDYTLDVPLGSSLEVRNPQGSVRIEDIHGDAWVESVGGSIIIADTTGAIMARSAGGEIQVIHPSGYVEATSVTGNLVLMSPTSSRIRASTTSGRITYDGSPTSAAEYVMSSYSGDIDIMCPPAASFELNARSVHGKLVDLLKLHRRHHHDSVSYYGNALFGMHNEGAATLEVTSFTGTIRVSPQEQH